MLKAISLLMLLAGAACGGSSKPETAPTNTTPASTALALGEMKLIDLVGNNKAVLIHADGTIEFEGETPAKVTSDGKLVATATGEAVLELQADGSLKDKNGTLTGATLTPEGAIIVKEKTIALDDSGQLVLPDKGPVVKVEGATTAGLKRTAMLVLLALVLSGDPHTEAGPEETGTVAVPPMSN